MNQTNDKAYNAILFPVISPLINPTTSLTLPRKHWVVSPGKTLRYERRETTTSNHLLLWSSRRPALWTNKLTLNMWILFESKFRLSRICLRLQLLP